jgi:hypothetical protein
MMVRVRSRRHVVEEVMPPTRGHPLERHLVVLSCVDDDNAGERAEVIWENEPDARILSARESAALEVDALDPPERFAAWYYALRWNSLSVAETKRVQAPFRAGISVESYQFLPLRRALEQPRVRLFIADDVGLGKTIEAGLILRELMLRQRVRRVVVAAPPSVVTQWREELESRFGLTFVDRRPRLRHARAAASAAGPYNPWRTHSRFIISHALLRDEALHRAPARLARAGPPTGSLLMLDEAHHAAPASGALRHRLAPHPRRARPRAALRTPALSLGDAAQRPQRELLRPARGARPLSASAAASRCAGAALAGVLVRRLKSELRHIGWSFPKRAVVQVDARRPRGRRPRPRAARSTSMSTAPARSRRGVRSAMERRTTPCSWSRGCASACCPRVEAFARTLAVHRATLRRQRAEAATRRAKPIAQGALALDAPGADDEPRGASEQESAQREAMTSPRPPGPARHPPRAAAREDSLLDAITPSPSRTATAPTRGCARWSPGCARTSSPPPRAGATAGW